MQSQQGMWTRSIFLHSQCIIWFDVSHSIALCDHSKGCGQDPSFLHSQCIFDLMYPTILWVMLTLTKMDNFRSSFLNGLNSLLTYMYALGRGINKEGFNFKLAMVKTCSTWPLLNKYALQKKFEVGLQSSDPTVTSDSLHSLWERQKIENLNFVFAMVKMHSQQPKRNYHNI